MATYFAEPIALDVLAIQAGQIRQQIDTMRAAIRKHGGSYFLDTASAFLQSAEVLVTHVGTELKSEIRVRENLAAHLTAKDRAEAEEVNGRG